MNATNKYGPSRTPFGGRNTGRDKGYPVKVKIGTMSKAEILDSIETLFPNKPAIIQADKTAHNEVTRVDEYGRKIVRLRKTDIITFHPDKTLTIDTGGWNTPTTRRHIRNALAKHGIIGNIFSNKPKSTNSLIIYSSANREIINKKYEFEDSITITL